MWGMNMSGVCLPLACFLHMWQRCRKAQASGFYVPCLTAAPDPPCLAVHTSHTSLARSHFSTRGREPLTRGGSA